MKNNKLTLHYMIAAAAIAVVLYALYLLYQDPERIRFLILTIIACAVVALGQILIIRQKKSLNKK
ncbi:hypothetical protein [Pedobacter chitinilyticus]|uniref:Uncharacterized protein n=1 Tax=Pedobacter chitinilyticus TaxID=2233776 RepID=A0A3S3SU21_9SPHI|nr:hypothetical protein [Pedobacter chitinilyticus]RWU07393.1 hypothetical protein DPV69_10390 [Pedobacter chitinilyticus]